MQGKCFKLALALIGAAVLTGCANVQYGDKQAEDKLRQLAPIAGKASLYVCREAAAFVGAGTSATVFVDGRPIGTLKPNNFAHVALEPGPHEVHIKRNPGGESGVLLVEPKAGEVAIIWVGMTGAGFGALTLDYFSSRPDAERCVKAAGYAVRAD